MTQKEATIIAYALQLLSSQWDETIEESLTDIAILKDIKFLQSKYEGFTMQSLDDEQ